MPIGIKNNDASPEIAYAQATIKNLSYEDQKSRRILRQGVFQAVLQSPGLAGLPFANYDEFVKLVERTAEHVIGLVEK